MRHRRYFLSVLPLVLIGIVVAVGIQSIERAARAGYAADSRYFFPLVPGVIAGWILSGGHAGSEKVAWALCWIVDTGMYWFVLVLPFRLFRKRAVRRT
jgi:hypothetical protein